jgi:DNA-binding CsgD family transcriptional regulator
VAIAGGCVGALAVVCLVEIVTPDVVVGVFALLPLLTAVWVLSSRLAGLVALVGLILFVVAVALEANRTTVVAIGVTIFMTTGIARLYATGLASLIASHRHPRMTLPSRATPPTLEGMDRWSHGVSSLTRRELEVFRLAAEGYTAMEIGQQLHIGGRTVESHLASAYSKLRINSRGELIRLASRLGIHAGLSARGAASTLP